MYRNIDLVTLTFELKMVPQVTFAMCTKSELSKSFYSRVVSLDIYHTKICHAHHFMPFYIMLIILFLVLYFNFLFVPCGRLSWLVLPVSFLLHVKHTLSYRIVSYQTSDVNLRGP